MPTPKTTRHTLMTAEGVEAFRADQEAKLAEFAKDIPLRVPVTPHTQQIAKLAMKLVRPWIEGAAGRRGSLTDAEWCAAFDEIERHANGPV